MKDFASFLKEGNAMFTTNDGDDTDERRIGTFYGSIDV